MAWIENDDLGHISSMTNFNDLGLSQNEVAGSNCRSALGHIVNTLEATVPVRYIRMSFMRFKIFLQLDAATYDGNLSSDVEESREVSDRP